MLNKFFQTIFLIGLTFNASFKVEANQDICKNMFANKVGNAQELKNQLVSKLKDAGVPMFMKSTVNGDIPVVLVSSETAPKLHDIIEGSFGTGVHLQPDWKNDHGSMRVGEWLIDVDTPGARGYGEIHDTGLSWRNFDGYTKKTQKNIVETTFILEPTEMQSAMYYQKIRRSALFRVPFTFGGNQAAQKPNLLTTGEHCFIFSKGSANSSHINEINSRLQKLGINAQQILTKVEINNTLSTLREKIARLNTDDKALSEYGILEMAKPLTDLFVKEGIAVDKAVEVTQWLISYDATSRYGQLLANLQIRGGSGFEDMNSPRASLILIYDAPGKAKEFQNASYTAKGFFNNWTTQGQKTSP